MSRASHTDEGRADSTFTGPSSRVDPDCKSPRSNATASIRRVDSMESTEHSPHVQASDALDEAGQLDENEGVTMLLSIIFGILAMAVFGALFTLLLTAS